MIVADTNLVAQLILALDQTEEAQAIYRLDPDWRLPELWRHEFLNVLASYLRFDRVPLAKLRLAWKQAIELFAMSTYPADLLAALEISGECSISAYDAQFVALAREFGVPLITQDRKLLRAAPAEAMSMKRYLVSAPG